MVIFINNGSQIITWMGYRSKAKSTKSKATHQNKNIFFLNFKLQIIRSVQYTGVVRQITKTAIL